MSSLDSDKEIIRLYKNKGNREHTRKECKHPLVQGPSDLDWKVNLVYQEGSGIDMSINPCALERNIPV